MAKWAMETIFSAGYGGLVFLMFLENVFPPIPSELIMPLAGYLASTERMALAGVIVAGTIGSVMGALPLYYAGRRLGAERLKHFADRHGRWLTLCGADIERANQWFKRHGGAAVFFGRLVPGIRSLISIPAGISRMNLALFLTFTTVGAALWTAVLASLGYVLGRNFKQIDRFLDPASWVVLGLIIGWYVYRVARQGARLRSS
jgi:membrane protein DedA with SNARE-associated domain